MQRKNRANNQPPKDTLAKSLDFNSLDAVYVELQSALEDFRRSANRPNVK